MPYPAMEAQTGCELGVHRAASPASWGTHNGTAGCDQGKLDGINCPFFLKGLVDST